MWRWIVLQWSRHAKTLCNAFVIVIVDAKRLMHRKSTTIWMTEWPHLFSKEARQMLGDQTLLGQLQTLPSPSKKSNLPLVVAVAVWVWHNLSMMETIISQTSRLMGQSGQICVPKKSSCCEQIHHLLWCQTRVRANTIILARALSRGCSRPQTRLRSREDRCRRNMSQRVRLMGTRHQAGVGALIRKGALPTMWCSRWPKKCTKTRWRTRSLLRRAE